MLNSESRRDHAPAAIAAWQAVSHFRPIVWMRMMCCDAPGRHGCWTSAVSMPIAVRDDADATIRVAGVRFLPD